MNSYLNHPEEKACDACNKEFGLVNSGMYQMVKNVVLLLC